MSGIITPGQSKLVLHNRSEPYELTYNIAKRWGNNKSRIVLISESGSNAQPVPQISQTFHFLNIIPRGAPIWKAFAQEPLLLSQLRVQSATLEEKGRRYVYIPVYICMDIYIYLYRHTETHETSRKLGLAIRGRCRALLSHLAAIDFWPSSQLPPELLVLPRSCFPRCT